MPGVVQHTRDSLRKAAAEAAELGLGGVMLFGIPEQQGRRRLRRGRPRRASSTSRSPTCVAEVGDALTVMSDLCLDEFTDHGHCGVLDARRARSTTTRTLEVYAEMALAQAAAGVDMVGPSGMMDGQVGVIRAALDGAGHHDVAILAYSAKYASAFYGPFREAVDSSLQGDRRTYQQDAGNVRRGRPRGAARRRGGRRHRDGEAGAGLPRRGPPRCARRSTCPVAAYNVSGEYAMVEAAAAHGWIDRERRDPRDAHLDPPGRRRRDPDLLGRRGRAAPLTTRAVPHARSRSTLRAIQEYPTGGEDPHAGRSEHLRRAVEEGGALAEPVRDRVTLSLAVVPLVRVSTPGGLETPRPAPRLLDQPVGSLSTPGGLETPRLAVMPSQVGQPGDGCGLADRGVGPVVVVLVDPCWQGGSAG